MQPLETNTASSFSLAPVSYRISGELVSLARVQVGVVELTQSPGTTVRTWEVVSSTNNLQSFVNCHASLGNAQVSAP